MFVCCECCEVEVSATGLSLVPMCPTDCGVPEYDLKTSTMNRPWPSRGAMEKNI